MNLTLKPRTSLESLCAASHCSSRTQWGRKPCALHQDAILNGPGARVRAWEGSSLGMGAQLRAGHKSTSSSLQM